MLSGAEKGAADLKAIEANLLQGSGPDEQHTSPAASRSGLGAGQSKQQTITGQQQLAANKAAPKHSPVSAAELQLCSRLGRCHICANGSHYCSSITSVMPHRVRVGGRHAVTACRIPTQTQWCSLLLRKLLTAVLMYVGLLLHLEQFLDLQIVFTATPKAPSAGARKSVDEKAGACYIFIL